MGLICPAGQAGCGRQCIDVTADPTNCGGCGIPCSTGQICEGGACVCTSGLIDCNGSASRRARRLRDAERASTLVTSAPGAYWKTDGPLTEVTSGNADVTVNDTSTAQTWEGFGGAFNEMGWNVLSLLSRPTGTPPSASCMAPTARASPSAASRSARPTTR